MNFEAHCANAEGISANAHSSRKYDGQKEREKADGKYREVIHELSELL
jgi:hypothetical protein